MFGLHTRFTLVCSMDDDNGLDLSLALPSGGSSSRPKDTNGSFTEDGDRTSKILNDFKNFLNGGIPQQAAKPPENLFPNFSQVNVEEDASGNGNERSFWISSREKASIVDEDKGPNVGDKRKSLTDATNLSKRQESEAYNSDLKDKGKTSHISITTDEGSTADNEDVAESDAVSRHEDVSKRHAGSGSSSEVPKERHGQMAVSAPSFSVQSMSNLSVPYTITFKDSTPVGTPKSSGYPMSGIMQAMPTTGSEWAMTQPSTPSSMPMMFGFSPTQLANLAQDNSWGMVTRPTALHSYAGRGISASAAAIPVTNQNLPEATRPNEVRVIEQNKVEIKQPVGEGGCFSQAEDAVNGISNLFRVKSASELAIGNSFPSDYPTIKPGIAADLKFGGSGSLPNLPWVSTTAPGPNGRTISGVTYKFSPNQIRIVCACHGSHLSPEEFICHASEEQPLPISDNGGPGDPVSARSSSPAASAKS